METGSIKRKPLRSFVLLPLLIAASPAPLASAGLFDDDYVPPPHHLTQPAAAPVTDEGARPPHTPERPPEIEQGKTAPPTLLATPAAADQMRSRKLLKKVFAHELEDRSSEGRRALADKLLAEAERTADNPSDRFVLLVGACDAAIEGGDLGLAGRAAETAASLYQIDATNLAVNAALKSPIRAATADQAHEDLETGLRWEAQLAKSDDYPDAARLLSALQPLTAADPTAGLLLQEQRRQLDSIRSARDRAQAASERLKSKPTDAVANTSLGEFLCFVKEDFQNGLPALAQSADPALRAAAKQDLAGAATPTEQIAHGDGWWQLANSSAGTELFKAGMRQRAIFWYRKALASGQVTGLNRTMIEKRVAGPPPAMGHAGSIDLISLFAPSEAVAGQWSLGKASNRTVLVNREGEFCRFQFPYQPPDEFDFAATFTYTTKGGPIILMCPLSDGAIMWYTEFNKSAFMSRGKRGVEGREPFIMRNRPNTSLVKVRKDKVQGYLNDRLVCEFDRHVQEAPALSDNWSLPNPAAAGVGVWSSDTVFTRLEITEVSGPGKRLPASETSRGR